VLYSGTALPFVTSEGMNPEVAAAMVGTAVL
jgi:hypothetical protein